MKKRKGKQLIILFLQVMFISSVLLGQNRLYVDKYNDIANDQNSGSEEEPLLTISKALDLVNAGDEIIIGPGRYDERIRISKSGNASNYITIKGKNTPSVIFPDGSNAYLENASEVTSLSGIDVEGSYIIFENLEITRVNSARSGIYLRSVENLKFRSNFLHELECSPNNWGGIRGIANNVEVTDNIFWRVEGAAIYLEGENWLIKGNDISHTSNQRFSDGLYIGGAKDGIRLHGSGHRIVDNVFHDFFPAETQNTSSLAAIRSYTYNTTNHILHDIFIQNNLFTNIGDHAVYITDSKENSTWDPIYNITISNNIISGAASTAVDIMDAANVYFINNTIAYCNQGLNLRSGGDRSGCDNSVVLNNIFYQCNEISTYSDDKEDNSIWDYNLHYPEIVDAEIISGYEEHSLFNVKPMFNDPKNLGFNLHEYSAAVDAGTNASNYINAIDYNYDFRPQGNSWDVGAVESPYTWIPNTAPIVTISSVTPMVPGENEELNILISVVDQENNDSKVMVDWGDGTITDWSEFIPANSNISYSHQYAAQAKYQIRVKAVDERLWESEWTDGYQVLVYNGSDETDLRVEPSLNVEVGEEVFFDVTGYAESKGFYNSHTDLRDIEVTWDFGDGYKMAHGFPRANGYSTGVACTHFFMKPGAYVVTMTMTNNGRIDSAKAIMKVTGEAPIEGFELWRANFHARIAQFIYAQIPETVTQEPSNQLIVSVIGDNGYNQTLVQKSGISNEEKFLLKNADLPAGSYVLQAELKTVNGQRISIIREKFDKPYDGAPKVGYNEYNSLIVDGKPFFPISPWLLNTPDIEEWGKRYINTTRAIGYYPVQDRAAWADYIDKSWENGCYAVGPERYENKGWGRGDEYWNNYRNTDVRTIEEYIQEFKDHPATLFWFWQDEVNLGGPVDEVPVEVNSAWSYLSHKNDSQHPHWTQYYGLDYGLYARAARNDSYNYLYNEDYFGGKKHFTSEMISHDIYPYDGFPHPGLVFEGKGPIHNWVDALEQLKWRNYNLVAAHQSIAAQDIFTQNEAAGITDKQMRMITWLAIAHEIKGINWFQFFAETPPENFNVMAEFLELTTNLAPVILGTPSEITVNDNANDPGNRVDVMVRETDKDIYLFAVRLTEPDVASYLVSEPEVIDVQFSLNNANGNILYAEDYSNLNQRITEYINVNASSSNFELNTENKITPGTLLLAGWLGHQYDDWMRVYDDSLGNLYTDRLGIVCTGKVDYETGNIQITFGEEVQTGENNIRIAYKPVNEQKIIPISGGSFSDTFAKEDVKIYRIPKDGALPNFVKLNVESENGTVVIDPLQEIYTKGSEVTITAFADSGYQFIGFSGSIETDDNPLSIVLDSTMTITANFEEIPTVTDLININFDNNIINNANNELEPFWSNGEGSFTEGVSGQAVSFDGTQQGSWVRIKRSDILENLNDVTISLDAKKNSANSEGTLFIKHVCYRLEVIGNRVTGYVFLDGERLNFDIRNLELINNTDWHNYTLRYNGSELTILVDGIIVDSQPASGNLFRSSTVYQDLHIGKYPWGNSFDGAIDNFVMSVPQILTKDKLSVEESDLPSEYNLEQNYPNPFNPTTTIQYSLPNASLVKVSVFNLLGQEVTTLVNEFKEAGRYSVNFNAGNLTSGMYIYTISAGTYRESKKMLLIK